jgi:hypothetical protein
VVDVSGFGTDERGRLVNTDIPDEERRRSGKGKKKKSDKVTSKKEKLKRLAEEADDTPKKKKRKSTDDELPVKKKKSKSKELKPIDAPAPKKSLKKLDKKARKVAEEMAELEVFTAQAGDAEFDNQYNNMFRSLQGIIDTFEVRMRDNPSSRDVYALSTLYSQIREVMSDIRSSQDVAAQIASLEETAYRGFMKAIGQTYVNIYFQAMKSVRTHLKDDPDLVNAIDAELGGILKDQSAITQEAYGSMVDRVREVLA